jgi:fatty acid synthase
MNKYNIKLLTQALLCQVLIHQASGGVGQAAIAVALSVSCEVFATVSNETKKQYLVKKFPNLDPDHIVISSDRSFEFHIRRVTRYRGVDVVLNTHSYGKLRAGLRVLAPSARFLDLERTDAAENKLMGTYVLE